MKIWMQRTWAVLLLLCLLAWYGSATAYDGRGDYPESYRDRLIANGLCLFLDHGAAFVNCNFEYANTHAAPGRATLFTGVYSDGHCVGGNAWWDPERQRVVTSVSDPATNLVGVAGEASPHNLRTDTLGDELKLATGGRSRVLSISLKDRSAILRGGYSADAAYWIDRQTGTWITSSYYMNALPAWVQQINNEKRASVLGIDAPSASIGRVLTEALAATKEVAP